MRQNDKFPISVKALEYAMKASGTNKSRIARECNLSLRTIQRCFTEGKASNKTLNLICEVLHVDRSTVAIENPFAQWQERRLIHREEAEDIFDDWQEARCSSCKRWLTTPTVYGYTHYDYCPHCGMRMEK